MRTGYLRYCAIISCIVIAIGCVAGWATADRPAKNIILLIGDGMGFKQVEAANRYTDATPLYQNWAHYASATPDYDTISEHGGIGYDPKRFWSDWDYATSAATDSASAATAMYTGVKVDNGNINTDHGDKRSLYTITDAAAKLGKAYGAVSTVPVSHATPGAWIAHNNSRGNTYAIISEGLWGDPNAIATTETDDSYGGGWGKHDYTATAIIGGGHPDWCEGYVSQSILGRLQRQNGTPGGWTLVERVKGSPDGGKRLLAAAGAKTTDKLVGLFGGDGGNFEYRYADGHGRNPENPTLAECAIAALTVLNRDKDGFVLMIEGGAIDWGNHANNLNAVVGEAIDFNDAVRAVTKWVEDPRNGAGWENTLVIVTADHESGYLTAGPKVFPKDPLGLVNDYTLSLEKKIKKTGCRGSWEDTNKNGNIDPGETVYWAFNSGGHSNSLVPLWTKGAGSDIFDTYAFHDDPVRGRYINNTAIFDVMWEAMRSTTR